MVRQGRLGVLVALLLSVWTAVAAAAPFAYITNSGPPLLGGGTITIVDTANNTVAGTITLPAGSVPWAVALNPAGTRLYVTNFGNGALFVIDTANNSVIATIPMARQPIGIAVNPAGTRVYITHFQVSGFFGALTVVDATTNTVLSTVNAVMLPVGVAVNPAGTSVYVAAIGGVRVYDSALVHQATIPVGIRPFGLAFNPSGSRLYVTNQGSNTVSVINTADHSLAGEVSVGLSPHAVALNPDGTRAYVANRNSNSVSIINTSDNTLMGDVPVGPQPYGLQVGSGGRFVYVANNGSSSVSIIDTANNNSVSSLQVGSMPVAFGNFIQPAPASRPTATTLEVTPNEAMVGSTNPVTARATLTGRDTGAPVEGASIAFSLDGGSPSVFNTDANGVASWSINPASLSIGTHTVRAAFAEATIGGVRFEGSSASRDFRVIFQWGGWVSPVDGGVLNAANAGSTIPLKWTLRDANGNVISSPGAVLKVQTAMIDCSGNSMGELQDAVSADGGLRVDGASGRFQFNWKTDKAWAGQCRTFAVTLADGTMRRANFQFK